MAGLKPLLLLCCLVFGSLALAATANADVTRDGTLGPGSALQPTGPDFVIDQGMGALQGRNLFHSFASFDLEAEQTATFTALAPVDNVIARVTGGSASHIDGSVSVDIAGASLFLLNPDGLLLGPDAEIDVEGDLFLGTADYLAFTDGNRFAAGATGPVMLSTAPPSAFGFLDTVVAPIDISGGSLRAGPGRRLVLAAGDIDIEGSDDEPLLATPSGRLVLFAAASAGEFVFDGSFEAVDFVALGDISLAGDDDDGGDIDDEDGEEPGDDAPPTPQIDVSGSPAGLVLLAADKLSVSGFVIAANSLGGTSNPGSGIVINVPGEVTLDGEALLASNAEGNGNGAGVSINVGELRLSDDAEILSDTRGSGAGGLVEIVAGTLTLAGDAEIATDTEGSGTGGDIRITVGRLDLLDNSEISSDTDPDSTGPGGSIRIGATEIVNIVVPGTEPAGLFANTEGGGDAGDILIDTAALVMRGGVITAETTASGTGGTIEVDTALLALRDGASITALSSGNFAGAGDAGNISIRGLQAAQLQQGTISTASEFSDGGNITVGGEGLFLARNSLVSADVEDGTGGNLELAADTVVLDDSRLVAQAGTGQGGNILVATQRFLQSDTLISASSRTGISGIVTIDAPNLEIGSELSRLAGSGDAPPALQEFNCQAGPQRTGNRFVIAARRLQASGNDGLPLVPDKGSEPGNTDPLVQAFLDRIRKARLALGQGQVAQAAALLKAESPRRAGMSARAALAHAWLRWSDVMLDLAMADRTRAAPLLLEVHARLTGLLGELDPEQSPRTRSFVLGQLARLYALDDQALVALAYARQAVQSADRADAPDALYRWLWLQGRILWQLQRPAQAIAALRASVRILNDSRQEATILNDSEQFFKRSIAPVYRDLVDVLLRVSDMPLSGHRRLALWQEARGVIERFRAAELREYYSDPCVAEVVPQRRSLDTLTRDTAVVYPILLPGRMELLVTIDGKMQRHTVAVDPDELAQEITKLRGAIQRFSSAYVHSARRLYDWLVRPYRAQLLPTGVANIVFVPDGPLRGLPFAALMDGDRFLVEDHAIAVTPGLNLVAPQALDRERLPALLAGVSQQRGGHSELPGVPGELASIQRLFGGDRLLDESFTLGAFEQTMRTTQPALVHIASHAQFGDGPEDSYVLAYDGRLAIDALARQIAASRDRDRPLELLVLSACQTAQGDERAALGLAGVAVRAGARSALGSLWSIADEATAQLMQGFYDHLYKAGASRAQALRHAQRMLLADARFRHPLFWSPFLLINNWL